MSPSPVEYHPHRKLLELLQLPESDRGLIEALFRICDNQLQLHWSYTLNLLVLLQPLFPRLAGMRQAVLVIADGRFITWTESSSWYDVRSGEACSKQQFVITQAVDLIRLRDLETTRAQNSTGAGVGKT